MTVRTNGTGVWAALAAPLGGGPALHETTLRLDEVVPGEWDATLELLPPSVGADGEPVQAFKARIQILGVVREAVGMGADYRRAATDAYLAAARMFGVGPAQRLSELSDSPPTGAPNAPASAPAPRDARTSAATDPKGAGGGAGASPIATREMTLEEAKQLPLMGKAENWGGHGGTPIGELSTDLLESARAWFENKEREATAMGQRPSPRRAEQLEAITLVLEDRAKDQTTLELEGDDDDVPADVPSAAAPADAGVMPPPGRVADALPPAREPKRRRKDVAPAPAEPAAAAVGVGADGTGNSVGDLPEPDPATRQAFDY